MARCNMRRRACAAGVIPAPLTALLCLLATLSGWQSAFSQAPLKVLIAVDMEGITGVVSPGQFSASTGFEYERFRVFMTNEALAAVQGARDAGATEIVVVDSHGNGQNLLVERFSPDTRIVRSWPRPHGMMHGIDSTFGAAVFIGYHASSSSTLGIRAHTITGMGFISVDLNGQSLPESGLGAAVAGHFGVPVVMISGDDSATAELKRLIPKIETAVVKSPIAFNAGITLTPEAGQALIRAAVRDGVRRRREIAPFRLRPPIQLDLTLRSIQPAELLAYLSIVKRTSARGIRYAARDVPDAVQFLQFVTNYRLDLDP
jgi:D-amino peptidase